MTKAKIDPAETPLMIAEVIVPQPFIEWAATELFRRDSERVDSPLIAFVFREVIERMFTATGRTVDLGAAVERAIEKYELALRQLCEEQSPPDDEARH